MDTSSPLTAFQQLANLLHALSSYDGEFGYDSLETAYRQARQAFLARQDQATATLINILASNAPIPHQTLALSLLPNLMALNAIPHLERALAAPEPTLRLAALKALAEFPPPHPSSRILLSLHDPDLTVRSQALSSLLALDPLPALETFFSLPLPLDPPTRRTLAQYLLNHPDDQSLARLEALVLPPANLDDRAVAECLLRFSPPAALPHLQRWLHLPRLEILIHACDLARQAASPLLLPDLAPLLSHPDPRFRCVALQAIQPIHHLHTVPLLAQALRDPYPRAQLLAAVALRDFPPAFHLDVARALLPALPTLCPDATRAACQALQSLAPSLASDSDIRPALHQALEAALTHPDTSVRLAASSAAAALGSPALLPPLLALQSTPDWYRHVDATASAVLAALPSSLTTFAQAVQTADASTRANLACVLGKVPGDTAATLLTALLADPDAHVRANAACSAGEAQCNALAPALTLALLDPDGEVRGRAGQALGKLHALETAPALIQALETALRRFPADLLQPQYTELTQLVSGLRDLATDLATPCLIQASLHPDWRLRRDAATALGRLAHPQARDRLLALCADPHERVAGEASAVLSSHP